MINEIGYSNEGCAMLLCYSLLSHEEIVLTQIAITVRYDSQVADSSSLISGAEKHNYPCLDCCKLIEMPTE